eukprot:TRINITY_DN3008_c0_g1_i1.p1 TRINITY_DN3008_c0_g1~~TRINITY_DN3008_c0_g1_i1.p1  ORF type:complete len:1232 (+),score=357.83 TRINITY_DN3008_c0_g1_i1:261-3956(+)
MAEKGDDVLLESRNKIENDEEGVHPQLVEGYMHVQDALEEMEVRVFLSGVVSEAITNGILNDTLAKGRDLLEGQRTEPNLQHEEENLKIKHQLLECVQNLQETKLCKEIESFFTAMVLERGIEEAWDKISKELCLKNEKIDSLVSELKHVRSDYDMLHDQVCSKYVVDEERENNLSTLKATMEMQCSQLKQELSDERGRIRENLSRIWELQQTNDSLAERSKKQNACLQQLHEKLTEQHWQQEMERQILAFALGCNLTDAAKQITGVCSSPQHKEAKISFHMKTLSTLQSLLHDRSSGMSRVEELLKFLESQIGALMHMSTHKFDSLFDSFNAKLVNVISKLENLGETMNSYIENIQKQASAIQEEMLEHQFREEVEVQISEVVLEHVLRDLYWIKRIEEVSSSMHEGGTNDERVQLLNELRSLHQELESMKLDETHKLHWNADGANTKGVNYLSNRFQEGKSVDSSDNHRKGQYARRHSVDQLSTEIPKKEDAYTTCSEGKVAEVQPTKKNESFSSAILETADLSESPLRNMSQEQLLGHCKQLVAKMRRDHETELQKKIDEIYCLKRELLNEKGGLHFKRERELNALKKKVAEVTKMLDRFVEKNDKFALSAGSASKYKEICSFKDQWEAERKYLLKQIKEKDSELKTLTIHLSDALEKAKDHALRESSLLNNLRAAESKQAETETAMLIRIDILSTLFVETMKDKSAFFNMESNELKSATYQQCSVEQLLNDKGRLLNIAQKENEELKQQVALLEKVIEEKENLSRSAMFGPNKTEHIEGHEKALDLALRECKELKSDILCKHSTVDNMIREQEEVNKQLMLMKDKMDQKEVMLMEELSKEKEKALLLESRYSETKDQAKAQERLLAELREDLRLVREQLLSVKETLLKEETAKKSLSRHFEEACKEKESLKKLIREKEDMWDMQYSSMQRVIEQKETILTEEINREKERFSLLEAEQLEVIEQNEEQKLQLVILGGQLERFKKQALATNEALQKEEATRKNLLMDFEKACKEKEHLQKMIEEKQETLKFQMGKEQELRNELEESKMDKENACKVAAIDNRECKERILLLEKSLKEKQYEIALLENSRKVDEEKQRYALQKGENLVKNVIQNMQGMERRVSDKIEANMLRLENNKRQLLKLCEKHSAFLMKETSRKKKLEQMSQNLRKAEQEVDLLGDDVDALLDLLGKIYISLNRYSPILQHYPGMVELLTLTREKLVDNFYCKIQC